MHVFVFEKERGLYRPLVVAPYFESIHLFRNVDMVIDYVAN